MKELRLAKAEMGLSSMEELVRVFLLRGKPEYEWPPQESVAAQKVVEAIHNAPPFEAPTFTGHARGVSDYPEHAPTCGCFVCKPPKEKK